MERLLVRNARRVNVDKTEQEMRKLGRTGVLLAGTVSGELAGQAVATREFDVGTFKVNLSGAIVPDPGNRVCRIKQPAPGEGRPRPTFTPACYLDPLHNPADGQGGSVTPRSSAKRPPDDEREFLWPGGRGLGPATGKDTCRRGQDKKRRDSISRSRP